MHYISLRGSYVVYQKFLKELAHRRSKWYFQKDKNVLESWKPCCSRS